ncbi:MAG: hypothetical protein ACYDEP_10690 [Acidimicrobiales bacterium]
MNPSPVFPVARLPESATFACGFTQGIDSPGIVVVVVSKGSSMLQIAGYGSEKVLSVAMVQALARKEYAIAFGPSRNISTNGHIRSPNGGIGISVALLLLFLIVLLGIGVFLLLRRRGTAAPHTSEGTLL